MSKTVAAIVGRPNVGKSTLFNKIAGERISIVDDTPGVTRDRIYCDTEWNGRTVTMIDTGGIEPKADTQILAKMKMQAEAAIETADVIIFMCDIHTGVTADDRDIATMLIRSGKPVVLCINKVDSVGALPPEFYEFYELGFDSDPIAVSSIHGTGTGDLLDAVLDAAPEDDGIKEEDDRIRIAVIGKPNSGKSSIVNRFLGEERMIVSDIPGTTRDAVDSRLDCEYGKFTLVDTAGLRRQSRVYDNIEKYSVLRAKSAVEKADVCLIMINAEEGITEQDEKIAGLAHEAGKASVILVNKWDLIEKDNNTVKSFTDKIYTSLGYMQYAPVLFVSALTGQRISRVLETVNYVYGQSVMRISTGMLNDVLNEATTRVQPPTDKGRRLKIYYMTQSAIAPPTFVIFVNDAELFHFSYQRYLENNIRETFGFKGTPIRFIVREKGDS